MTFRGWWLHTAKGQTPCRDHLYFTRFRASKHRKLILLTGCTLACTIGFRFLCTTQLCSGTPLQHFAAELEDVFSLTLCAGYADNPSATSVPIAKHQANFAAYRNVVRRTVCLQPVIEQGYAADFLHRITYCHSRRLAHTQDGRLVLAPCFAQPGDVCCIFLGVDGASNGQKHIGNKCGPCPPMGLPNRRLPSLCRNVGKCHQKCGFRYRHPRCRFSGPIAYHFRDALSQGPTRVPPHHHPSPQNSA